MLRFKIRVSNPGAMKKILQKADDLKYMYHKNNIDRLLNAQCLLYHPVYGLYPIRDEEFELHTDFIEIKEEDFLC